jgi:hypothetical protein
MALALRPLTIGSPIYVHLADCDASDYARDRDERRNNSWNCWSVTALRSDPPCRQCRFGGSWIAFDPVDCVPREPGSFGEHPPGGVGPIRNMTPIWGNFGTSALRCGRLPQCTKHARAANIECDASVKSM